MSVRFEHKVINNTQVFTVNGTLQFGQTADVKESLLAALKQNVHGYILDFTHLENIDSTGMGLLITMMKHVEKSEPLINLVITDEFIIELFEIAKLNHIFPIFSTIEEALSTLHIEE